MRNWISFLLLIPMCLCLMISGVAEPTPADITTSTEEITLTTTELTTETIVQEVTEATIGTTEATEGEDIDSDEWFVPDDPNYIPPSKQPTDVTEPAATEPEKQEPELISLGRFKLTAYCGCRKCCGKYADNRPVDENGEVIVTGSIGVRLYAGVSIAVDPRVISYHTHVLINGHTYTAHDTGGSIKGNRIDVYFDDHDEAWDFGTQYAEVFVYAEED